MQLFDNEFSIGMVPTKSGVENAIIITKDALEKWIDKYRNNTNEIQRDNPQHQFMAGFWAGKADALIDILKHFDED